MKLINALSIEENHQAELEKIGQYLIEWELSNLEVLSRIKSKKRLESTADMLLLLAKQDEEMVKIFKSLKESEIERSCMEDFLYELIRSNMEAYARG